MPEAFYLKALGCEALRATQSAGNQLCTLKVFFSFKNIGSIPVIKNPLQGKNKYIRAQGRSQSLATLGFGIKHLWRQAHPKVQPCSKSDINHCLIRYPFRALHEITNTTNTWYEFRDRDRSERHRSGSGDRCDRSSPWRNRNGERSCCPADPCQEQTGQWTLHPSELWRRFTQSRGKRFVWSRVGCLHGSNPEARGTLRIRQSRHALSR